MNLAAVQLTALGADRSIVAALLGFPETTVRTYVQADRDSGIAAFKPFEVGGSPSALDAHSDTLRAEFEHRPLRTGKEAPRRLPPLTGLRRSPSSVRSSLKRLGLAHRQVAPIPAKTKSEGQKPFVAQELTPVLEETKRDKAAELPIQLLFLPPYSPNRHWIARLGKVVKTQWLHQAYHETFAELKQAMDACLPKTATDSKPQLDTWLPFNFQPFKAH